MFEHVDHPGLRALLSFEATRHHVAMEYREQPHWAGALPPFAPRVEVVAYCGDHQATVPLPVAGGTFPYEGPHLVLHDVPTLRLPRDDESGTPVCGVDGNRVLVFLSLETLFRLAEQVPRDTPDPTTPSVNPAHQVFDTIMSWALPLAIANIHAHDWQAEAAEFTRMKMELLDRSMRDWRDQIARNEREVEDKTWEIRNLVTAAQRLREALEGFQAHTRMQHRRRAAEEHAELVRLQASGAIRNLRCQADGIEFECGPMTIDHDDRDFVLGPYRVSVNLPEASFRVTGMPGCPKIEGYVHPHIGSGGTPCLGNAGPMLAKTLGTGDVVGGVQTILEFLRSYSDGNGYVDLRRWDPDYEDDDDRYQRCFDNSSCHDCVVCNDYDCPWRDGAEGRCWDYHDARDCIECGDCGYRDTAVENCRAEHDCWECTECEQSGCPHAGDIRGCHDEERCGECPLTGCRHHPSRNKDNDGAAGDEPAPAQEAP